MPKNASTKARKPTSKLVKIEVLPSLGPFAEFLHEKVLINRNKEIELMKEADIHELAVKIEESAYEVDRKRTDTLSAASLTLLEAWTCGSMLNIAKGQLKHGEFQTWIQDIFTNIDLSLRTAQRYMQLANSCPDAKDLISSKPSLRQAYLACGILPEPPEAEAPDEKDEVSRARSGLLKSFTGVQSKLRQFSEQKIRLNKSTKQELIAAKREIDQLFRKLVG